MRHSICLHKLKSIRRQSCKHLFQRQVMVKDGPTPSLTLAQCQPARTGKSLPNTDPAREQTLALQSKELSQVSYNTSTADRLGLCSQSRNHEPLQPCNAETSKQLMTTCLRCRKMHFSISCPAHVLQEAVKTTTFLHSSQVSSVISKAPSTD